MSPDDLQRRRGLLLAALGFVHVRCADPPPALVALHRWLDSWVGVGVVATGMLRQGYDVDLRSYEQGWRATFLHALAGRATGGVRGAPQAGVAVDVLM